MNVLGIFGNLCHFLAMTFLLRKIWRSKCYTHTSRRARFFHFPLYQVHRPVHQLYLHLQHSHEVGFLFCVYVTVYMIYGEFQKVFDNENYTFQLELLLVSVIGLSFLENYNFTPLEILWTFSLYMESVAAVPQIFLIERLRRMRPLLLSTCSFSGCTRHST